MICFKRPKAAPRLWPNLDVASWPPARVRGNSSFESIKV